MSSANHIQEGVSWNCGVQKYLVTFYETQNYHVISLKHDIFQNSEFKAEYNWKLLKSSIFKYWKYSKVIFNRYYHNYKRDKFNVII